MSDSKQKPESEIMKDIQLSASQNGTPLWRNNVGFFTVLDKRTGKTRGFRAGLCVGSSDLIGLTPITITEDMVGNTVAVFTAVEVKTKTGKPTKEQQAFIKAVKKHGGIAGVARSASDAEKLKTEYIEACKK